MVRLRFALLTTSLLLLSLACSTSAPAPIAPMPELAREVVEDAVAEDEYRIQVGDQLGVKFFFNPNLSEEVLVRRDGRISLQLIPEVMAAGRSPRELQYELRGHYSAKISDPEIAVIVRSSAQRIYVDGEVEKPGEVELIGSLTVLQAIAFAGGSTDRARLEDVVVIRRVGGKPWAIPVNLEEARSGQDPDQDLNLLPYDVVYVPRSGISNLNVWVDQYIRKNLPVSIGAKPF